MAHDDSVPLRFVPRRGCFWYPSDAWIANTCGFIDLEVVPTLEMHKYSHANGGLLQLLWSTTKAHDPQKYAHINNQIRH